MNNLTLLLLLKLIVLQLVTIRRSEKLGRLAKLMARPLAHSCPFAGRFGGLREVSDIEEDQRRSIEGKGVSRSLGESMEVE